MTFTITPDFCYQIDDLKVSQGAEAPASVRDTDVDIDPTTGAGTYKLTDIRSNYTIDATFALLGPFMVTAGVEGEGGTVSPETTELACGAELDVTLTPEPGYWIAGVKLRRGTAEPESVIDAVVIDPATGAGIYTLTEVKTDCEIEVSFQEQAPLTVTASVTSDSDGLFHGSISPKGIVWVEFGEEITFTLTPDPCYWIDAVKVTREAGEPQSVLEDVDIDPESGIGLYELRNIQSSYTIEVTLKSIALSGDVDGDCQISLEDAMLTLQIAAGQITPTEEQKEAADMNGDGTVASSDALAILREFVASAAPGVYIGGNSGRQINITLPDARGVAGESVIVPVWVDYIHLVAGGDICIAYDSSVLRAVDVSSDTGAFLASSVAEPGMVRIAFAGTNSLNGKTLAKIRFDILTDHISALELRQADLYQPDALPLDAKGIDGRFESWSIPAERTALLQNFPNPFNPDTWIPYQLKEGGEVTIQIFSLQGELVQALNLGYRSAGSYISQDRSVHWDGRNESGEEVASGIYFYSLRSNHYSIVRKLTILK